REDRHVTTMTKAPSGTGPAGLIGKRDRHSWHLARWPTSPCPVTFNSVSKLAASIMDNYAERRIPRSSPHLADPLPGPPYAHTLARLTQPPGLAVVFGDAPATL